MKIVIAGTRGIPARYGGFETFAEELSRRLVERGYEVTVYARRPFFSSANQELMIGAVRSRAVPTIMHKYFETPIHSFTTFIDLFRKRADIVVLCNAANSPMSWMVRLTGAKLITNVDGIERLRGKWNALGRLWYRLGEISAVKFSDLIVADAECIDRYYVETYACKTEVISYGATVVRRAPGRTLAEFGLQSGRFILYVSRLEPENNALGVIQAYTRLKTEIPLVIVGDAPYAAEYKEMLRRAANDRVVFTGFQFGEAYQELRSNCLIAVQATEVGGTHPALVEAMAYGNCVVANETPEHIEVLGEAGLYYPRNDFQELAKVLERLIADAALIRRLGANAAARAAERYSWERIVEQYEAVFRRLMGNGSAAEANVSEPVFTE